MKLMIGLLAAGIIGTGGFAFAAGLDDPQAARTVSLPAASTLDETTSGATTTDDIVTGNASATTTTGIDVPGPCDEDEHAGDPRCTGAVPDDDDRDDDNSGHGSRDDDSRGDRSGPNRGSDDDNDHNDD